MKNRICFISPFAYPLLCGRGSGAGGAERQFFLFGRSLIKEGWRINFITHTPSSNLLRLHTEFPVYPVNFSYLGGSKLHLPIALLGLWQAMYKANADYYILKVPSHLLVAMAVFCKIYRRCLVFWGQTTHTSEDQYRHISKHIRKIDTYGIRAADILIAQTSEQARILKILTGRPIHIIRNIAEAIVQNSGGYVLAEGLSTQFDVLWVGNSTPNKRPDIVLELARLMPDVSFAMAMNKSSNSDYEHWRKSAEILPNIHFLGELSPIEMEGWFFKAKILLNTSEREGFPNTFLQAWMNNVPVVSLKIDPDQLIRNYGFGRMPDAAIVEQAQNNETNLAMCVISSIRELLQNDELRKEIGLSAAQFVREHHAPDATVPVLIKALTHK